MSALNPNRRGASPGRPEHLYPGVWGYVFISSRAYRAAELSLGRVDEASAPTRAGLACCADCRGKMGRRLPARCRRYFRFEASGLTLACRFLGNQ